MMRLNDVLTWITIAAILIGTGMYLGKLQQQVSDLTQKSLYLHGDFSLPQKGS